MDELFKLDTILKYLQAHETATPNEIFAKHNMLLSPKLNLPSIRACIEKLGKDGYIRKNPDAPDNDQCVYTATIEGKTFVGYITSEQYLYKCKVWLKEPDNTWKIFTFFASPIIGFAFGLWLGHLLK